MQALAILMLICSDAEIFQPTGRYAAAVITVQDANEGAVRVPALYVTYAPFHCPPCDKLRSDIKAGKFTGIKMKVAPSWAGIRGYPSVRWQDGNGNWQSVAGYNESVRRFLIQQVMPTPQHTTSSQPRDTGRTAKLKKHWNINGDWSPTLSQTRDHLRSQHGVNTDGMTHQEMLDLHDSLHNGTTRVLRVTPDNGKTVVNVLPTDRADRFQFAQ